MTALNDAGVIEQSIKLAEQDGFGEENKYLGSAMALLKERSPKVIKKNRYDNFAAYVSALPRFYNANALIEHVLLGEGPVYTDDYSYNSMGRFFELVGFRAEIAQVVAVGPFKEENKGKIKLKFTDYFSPEAACKAVTVYGAKKTLKDDTLSDISSVRFEVASESVNQSEQVDTYRLDITRTPKPQGELKEQKCEKLPVSHFKQVLDHTAFPLDSDDVLSEISRLIQVVQSGKNIFIHCSAGLGRGGILLLCIELVMNYQRYTEGAEEEVAKKIHATWDKFNQVRPGVIQDEEQFENALHLAERVYHKYFTKTQVSQTGMGLFSGNDDGKSEGATHSEETTPTFN